MGIKVIQSGLLTTVQDLGRFHYQQYGICPAGAMDSRSFRLANILVGNDENAAELEMTMLGGTFSFTADTVAAFTGADMGAQLNGTAIPAYQAFTARAGDVLSFGYAKTGVRSYLAFPGGLDVPQVMGSRSTLLKASLGGYQGRKLQIGDEIAFGAGVPIADPSVRCMEADDLSTHEITLRVLPGPQDERFTEEGMKTLQTAAYTASRDNDRMGIRLEGPAIAHVTDANINSDGIALGSIQVPGSGLPIIMMADRQSVGGYTKIGNVITVDIPRLAQCREGDRIHFELVTIETAHALYGQAFANYDALRRRLDSIPTRISSPKAPTSYAVYVNGVRYDVTIQEED